MKDVVLVFTAPGHKTHVHVGVKTRQKVQKDLLHTVLVDLHHGGVRNLHQQVHVQPVVVFSTMLKRRTNAYAFHQAAVVGTKIHALAAVVPLKPPPQKRVLHHQIDRFPHFRQMTFAVDVPVDRDVKVAVFQLCVHRATTSPAAIPATKPREKRNTVSAAIK